MNVSIKQTLSASKLIESVADFVIQRVVFNKERKVGLRSNIFQMRWLRSIFICNCDSTVYAVRFSSFIYGRTFL